MPRVILVVMLSYAKYKLYNFNKVINLKSAYLLNFQKNEIASMILIYYQSLNPLNTCPVCKRLDSKKIDLKIVYFRFFFNYASHKLILFVK